MYEWMIGDEAMTQVLQTKHTCIFIHQWSRKWGGCGGHCPPPSPVIQPGGPGPANNQALYYILDHRHSNSTIYRQVYTSYSALLWGSNSHTVPQGDKNLIQFPREGRSHTETSKRVINYSNEWKKTSIFWQVQLTNLPIVAGMYVYSVFIDFITD